MKKQMRFLAVAAMLSMPFCVMAEEEEQPWYNPKTWFNKGNKKVSTTVTGTVDSIKDKLIYFKTVDGQILVLLGDKAKKVSECSHEAKIRVFGNVYKPSDKYPAGALQVRNYRVLEEAPATPVETTVSEPEPYQEPTLETAPEVVEDHPEIVAEVEKADDVVVEVVEHTAKEEVAPKSSKTYVVQSGDTLGKISSKVAGTTSKWKAIAEANGITNPKHLKVGMTLNIPENL